MNKFISLSNTDKFYTLNTNGCFVTNIDQLVLKKKYKVALTDFIYTNDLEILLGNIKIALSNITDEENDKHLKSMISFQDELNNIYFEILKSIAALQKLKPYDPWDFVNVSKANSNDVNLKNVEALCRKLLNSYTSFYFKMYANRERTYYYGINHAIYENISNLVDAIDHSYQKDAILKELNKIKFEELIKRITEFVNLNNKMYFKNLTLKLIDKTTAEDIKKYLIEKLSNDLIEVKSIQNKLLLHSKLNLKILNCDEKIKQIFKIKILNNGIEFTIPQKLNNVKYLSIQTDIIDEKEPPLRLIKCEGEVLANNIITYDRPHYFSINKTLINHIKIKITDQDKNIINFQTPPIIKLHLIESK